MIRGGRLQRLASVVRDREKRKLKQEIENSGVHLHGETRFRNRSLPILAHDDDLMREYLFPHQVIVMAFVWSGVENSHTSYT